jgi:phage-related protein
MSAEERANGVEPPASPHGPRAVCATCVPTEIVMISSGSTWKDKTRTMFSIIDAMLSIIDAMFSIIVAMLSNIDAMFSIIDTMLSNIDAMFSISGAMF